MSTTFAGKLYDWLQSINAAEYFDILQNADIDMELLVDLTEEDLRELGLSLGQRKRLHKGIESLRSGGQSGSVTSRAGLPTPLRPRPTQGSSAMRGPSSGGTTSHTASAAPGRE